MQNYVLLYRYKDCRKSELDKIRLEARQIMDETIRNSNETIEVHVAPHSDVARQP